MPALLGAVFFFGFRALLLTLVSVAACVFFEWGYCKLTGMNCKVYDMSAIVTGILIAFVCPVTIPYWTLIIGDFFAIIVVKMIFGGIGRNIINPALGGRAFMMSWALLMSTWIKVGFNNAAPIFGDTSMEALDGMTAATPMFQMHQGNLPDVSILNAFWGNVGGCLGETSVILLLVGLVYLLARKVVNIRIPAVYILSTVGFVALLQLVTGNTALLTADFLVTHLCGGGLLIGACFMANDYATSPITPAGQVIYALILGLLTALFRCVGSAAEGVSYAIILGNLMVPIIERLTVPKPFGVKKRKA
jgi:electron transport complex protein RnfD